MAKPASDPSAQALADARYPWEVLGIVMIGTLMAALDSSIVNVSLPAIMADFGASVDDIEWVVTGYMLSFATLMPLTTWFRSRIGHKALYIWSMVVFTFGSLLCGLAWNVPSLIVARVIQALGGGAVTPTGMAMVSEVFKPEERGKAIGIWGVGVIMGPAFGPTLGGYLTRDLGWRSIFTVNLPIGILGVLLAVRLLRPDRPPASQRTPFDFWGFLFLSLFLVCFLLGISKGEQEGWTSTYILTCALLSALGFIGFLLVETAVKGGIMDLALFKSGVFSACMVVNAVRSVALFGGTFLLPLFLQNIKGLDEVQSGLIMLPGALIIAVFMPISGRFSDRTGPFLPTFLGLLGVAWFMYLYRDLDVNTSVWMVILPTLIRGVGLGLLLAPSMAAALNAVPREKAAMASAMLNLVQQVAGSLGIAVLAMVLSHRVHFHLAVLGAAAQAGSPAMAQAMRTLSQRALNLGYPHAAAGLVSGITLAGQLGQAASVRAFDDSFLVGCFIVLSGVLASFLLPKKPVLHADLQQELAAME